MWPIPASRAILDDVRAVTIRKARADDLDELVRAMGQAQYFVDRIQRQQAGRGELITAWSARGHAIGAVYLWLEPADEPEIRAQLPGVPFLNHLQVAAPYRNRRVGTMLVTATERTAAALGHTQLALAVGLLNPEAERLYRRLGYQRWRGGQVRCVDQFGDLGVEVCSILVKTLADGIDLPVQRAESRFSRS